MTEIVVAVITALGIAVVPLLSAQSQKKKDRDLASETTTALTLQIEALQAHLKDCTGEKMWLRSRVEDSG